MDHKFGALAILGGAPAFSQPLHVGRPNIGNVPRFMERVQDILASGRLTNYGPYVARFEQRVCELASVKHCVMTCNATMALSLTANALSLSGSVIVPSFTFIATAHALQAIGLRVIFADIDAHSHQLSMENLSSSIASDTTAIVAVNLWGMASPVKELEQLCARRGLKLIFDSAQAFGATYLGQPFGGFGDAEVFSFHATKAVNSFEGGAITTNDSVLADRLRLAINFGFSEEDCISSWGTNAKMTEICAAMGLTSLEAMDSIFAHNRDIHARYATHLAEIPGLRLLEYASDEQSSYNYVVVVVDDRFVLTRDELFAVLRAENVLARRYFFPPGHRAEPYRNYSEKTAINLPVTEEVCRRVICLPTGTAVARLDVDRICAIIAQAQAHKDAIRLAISH